MHKLIKKYVKITISLLLIISMTMGLVSGNVFANGKNIITNIPAVNYLEEELPPTIPEQYEEAELSSEPVTPYAIQNSYTNLNDSSNVKSERRQKYEQLLEGNYFAGELVQKFHELFGDDYTARYIRDNYTDIFDVASDEIDEGFLNIIANVEHEYEQQLTMIQSDGQQYQIRENLEQLVGSTTTIENPYLESPLFVQPSSVKTFSATLGTSTTSSFSVNVTFPTEGAWGNMLEYWDGSNWIDITKQGLYSSSGTYTVTGVIPGKYYQISARYYDHTTSTWPPEIRLYGMASFPIENMQTYSKSNMEFKFDKWFADMFSTGRLDRFLNKVNNGYDVQLGLVGGNKPNNGVKMGFETSKTLPYPIEGRSGYPITWSINPQQSGVLVAPDHVLKMNQLNADLTEIPMHEIGHNFQKSSWNFEAEALTIFQIYYHMKTTGDTIAIASKDITFTGAAFKTYMKSYATRFNGQINYDAAMSQGIYSPYSLAYNLANIADTIGFQPFKLTFAFFDTLTTSQIPTTSIGKFNLFMSKLKDFSGQNVFGMLTTAEKNIYQSKLGGTIEYVTVATLPQGSGIIKGIVYNGGVLTPALTSSDLNSSMEISNLAIDTSNKWLKYTLKVKVATTTWTINSSQVVYSNPAMIPGDTDVLAMSLWNSSTWENVSTVIEESAETHTLLPANRNSLTGKTVIKIALKYVLTGDIYYFEGELPDSTIFAQAKAISYNADLWPTTTKITTNNNIYWYLDYTTTDGAANGITATGAQKGLAYNATQIKQKIGKSAFEQAFQYFYQLPSNEKPNNKLGRLNLFLTKLRDFSGIDVIALFTAEGKAVYESLFGGEIEYEFIIPNNTSLLNWPTESGEVTLWFGQVDEVYKAKHNGLDIQGQIGEQIKSISEGVVVFNGNHQYYGNVIYVNYKYNNVNMQVRYAHLAEKPNWSVGQKLVKGDMIGTMRQEDNGKGLMEITILKSTDGNACKANNSNTIPVDPMTYLSKPEYDDTYLQYPMATSIDINGTSTSLIAPMIIWWPFEDPNDPNIRYRENLDLINNENYLRKIVLEYVLKFDKSITNENIETKGILTYNPSTGIATVKINNRTIDYGVSIGNVVIKNNRMVVNRDAFWLDIIGDKNNYNTPGSPAYLQYLQYLMDDYRRNESWKYSPDYILQIMAGRAIQIMMNDVNRFSNTSSISDDYWRAFCQKFNNYVWQHGWVYEELHYFRNKLNRVPNTLAAMEEINKTLPDDEKWYLCGVGSSAYHMYTTSFSGDGLKNLKFVSYDGIYEAVYNQNGDLCTEKSDSTNMGTYNYASYKTSPIQHAWYDVFPYDNKLIPVINVGGMGWGNLSGATLPSSTWQNNQTRFYEDTTAVSYYNDFRDSFEGKID